MCIWSQVSEYLENVMLWQLNQHNQSSMNPELMLQLRSGTTDSGLWGFYSGQSGNDTSAC